MIHEVKSTCCYCGVGCGVLIKTDGRRVLGVRGDPEHPANEGRLCTKGATLDQTILPDLRLQTPERRLRGAVRGTSLSWDCALDEASRRFAEIIQKYGPNAVAFYISGQLLTEDYYVFNKLAKGLIGTNNVDTNSRLCMSSAVAGYKQTLGVDAPPCCYDDIAQAQTLLIAGANPAVAHPIVFRRIEDAKQANPALKIIVVDPRRTETAAIADLHLAIQPGTDIALFNAMLHVLVAESRVDRDYIARHTEGFATLEARLADYAPAVVAEVCGVPAEDIVQAARWFGGGRPALSLYCQGLNQSVHGTHNNAALIHLHLATGQIGKPGAGPFSLTGQPNAMGGREVGGLSNLLSAHRDLSDPEHRAEVAKLWGIPEVPAQPGKAAVDLFRALKTGEIKAVWIACTNPAHSLPHQAAVREALSAAEYVVLQEAYGNTDTAQYADLLLPASSWGEKSGTVTNSERRISRVRGAVPPPGEARHDWQIVVDFARRLGQHLGRGDEAERLFPYSTAEQIFDEHKATTLGRDLDIGGLSYAVLESAGPQQWPFPKGATVGRARLYEDGVFPTPSGRARFVAVEHQAVHDCLTVDAPISLISGRMRDQWHGMSRTGTVPRLFNLEDEPCLIMHPGDLSERGLLAGDIVEITNERGCSRVRVSDSAELKPGCAWLPMHWGSQFMNSPGANALACDAVDPWSQQPELKHAAVQVKKVDLPWPLAAIRRCDDASSALTLLQEARQLLSEFPYATVSLYGRQSPLVVFRAALAVAPENVLLERVDRLFGLDREEGRISFVDAALDIRKTALASDGRLQAVRFSGEAAALNWLKPAMAESELDAALLRYALAPSSKAPVATAPRHIICKCADVSDRQICDALSAGQDLAGLQERLKCGTFCGGCLPEIRKMASASRQTQPEAA